MPDICMIAAVGKSGQLGLKGTLPWQDAGDLRWFREMTRDGFMIAGTRTFEDMCKKLPITKDSSRDVQHTSAGRTLYRDPGFIAPEQVIAEGDLYGRTIWIVDGARTYLRWMHLVRRFYISKAIVNGEWYDGPSDVLMPPVFPFWNYC